jgi:eukaryotic-like serine/threonine-protein kinase
MDRKAADKKCDISGGFVKMVKPALAELKKLLSNIEIIEENGSGGFKIVYRARINGNMEALKLVQIPTDPNDADVKTENFKRICREINLLERCNTPYIVHLGTVGCQECQMGQNEYVFYSEEFIEGKSLRQMLKTGHRPDLAELILLMKCLICAIKELNSQKIIHRDIKPDNIIKTDIPDRPFILLDLGIAFQIGGTNLTRDTQRVPGTLYYIAPEMLDAGFRQNLDYRADLYTIGLTLYEYATGLNPYARSGEQPFSTIYRIKTENPAPLFQLRNDLPEPFCILIDGLMKKLPALRPANLDMLLSKVEEIR